MRHTRRFLFVIFLVILSINGCRTVPEKSSDSTGSTRRTVKDVVHHNIIESQPKERSGKGAVKQDESSDITIKKQASEVDPVRPKVKKVDVAISRKRTQPRKTLPPISIQDTEKDNIDLRRPFPAINKLVPASKATSPFLCQRSFITNWMFIGPFPFPPVKDDFSAVVNREYLPNEKGLNGRNRLNKGKIHWISKQFSKQFSNQPGQINVGLIFPRKEYCASYAVATLYSPAQLNQLKLYTGSSCLLKVWLNGQLIHTYDTGMRKSEWDQDEIKNINIKKGYNSLVVKTVHLKGPWNFYLRFSNKSGMPVCVAEKEKVTE